jgi:hypothetical protein
MTMPNFLIIGAIRSGTTSLYHYLAQHPEIYVSPVKEPGFFLFEDEESSGGSPARLHPDGWPLDDRSGGAVVDRAAYEALFSGVTNEKAIGEATPGYLTSPDAAVRIREHIPHARLIAILRNPIDRAFSSFLFHIRIGVEPMRDFRQAIEAGGWRMEHYIEYGLYDRALAYYDSYSREGRINVCLYDDLESDPLRLIQGIFEFLGIDRAFVPDMSVRYNVSGIPRRKWLNRVIWDLPPPVKRMLQPFVQPRLEKALRRVSGRNLQRPQLSDECRSRLAQVFAEDILRLQDRIGRDLSHWIKGIP